MKDAEWRIKGVWLRVKNEGWVDIIGTYGPGWAKQINNCRNFKSMESEEITEPRGICTVTSPCSTRLTISGLSGGRGRRTGCCTSQTRGGWCSAGQSTSTSGLILKL